MRMAEMITSAPPFLAADADIAVRLKSGHMASAQPGPRRAPGAALQPLKRIERASPPLTRTDDMPTGSMGILRAFHGGALSPFYRFFNI